MKKKLFLLILSLLLSTFFSFGKVFAQDEVDEILKINDENEAKLRQQGDEEAILRDLESDLPDATEENFNEAFEDVQKEIDAQTEADGRRATDTGEQFGPDDQGPRSIGSHNLLSY